MRIECKIHFKDYLKLQYVITYRNFWVLFITAMGLLMLVCAALEITGQLPVPDNGNLYIQIFFGIYVLLLPALVYWKSKKNFKSNKLIQEDIIYELSPDKFAVSTPYSNSEIPWEKIYKIKELKDWFLIYHSNKIAHLIPKKCMTAAEIAEAKYLFKQLRGPKLALKS